MKFIKILFDKLFKVNDTPQRVAAGFGIGVFSGILPGTGPLAALFLATLFRANRASAFLGGLLTNTWLSAVVFLLSVKIGAHVTGFDYNTVSARWVLFFNNFQAAKLFTQSTWVSFFKNFQAVKLFILSALKIIFPVMVGYIVVAFCCGVVAYLLVLMVLTITRCFRKPAIR